MIRADRRSGDGTNWPLATGGSRVHSAPMSKRNLATILWFLAGWVAAGGVFAMSGLPADLGAVVGAVLAGLVRWDPAGWIWTRPVPKRRVRPINEVAAELERNATPGVAAEAERVSR